MTTNSPVHLSQDTLTKLLSGTAQFVFDVSHSKSADSMPQKTSPYLFGEMGIAVADLIDTVKLDTIDQLLMEKVLYKAYDSAYSEDALFYYSSFYYSYWNAKQVGEEAVRHFTKANLDIMVTRLRLRMVRRGYAKFGTSVDNYFLERLDRFLWGVTYVYRKNREDLVIPALYAVCNLHQALFDFDHDSLPTNVRQNALTQLREVNQMLNEYSHRNDTQKHINDSPQLYYFITDQRLRFLELIGEDAPPEFTYVDLEGLDWIPQLRCLGSIKSHSPSQFVEQVDRCASRWLAYPESMPTTARALLLSVLARYWRIEYGDAEIGLSIKHREPQSVDIDNVLKKYFNAYQAIPYCPIGEMELNMLYLLDDGKLRSRVGSTLINIDPVVVASESKKPHGVSEIADMEIPLKIFENATHYLCMPFKSAIEIPGKTVPVEFAYQITRPFVFFDNCIVVFITAKKCSQPLLNFVKQLREKTNWPIAVVENEALAALLKLNNQLY